MVSLWDFLRLERFLASDLRRASFRSSLYVFVVVEEDEEDFFLDDEVEVEVEDVSPKRNLSER